MIIFQYDKTFEGLLTAVFEAYRLKKFPDSIIKEGDTLPLFYDETYTVMKGYNYKYTASVKSYKNNTLLDTISFDSKIVTY